MKYVLGIDDAGRGPVIGPMVLSGVLFKREVLDELRRLEVKDSKMLSPKRREVLYKQIIDLSKSHKIIKISPLEIDTREERGLNLNDLEAVKIAEIINVLVKDIDDVEVIIDCPSVNTVAWEGYLITHLKKTKGIKLKVEHKADSKYSACSASSIISKVERDAEIEEIKKKAKVDFGSGYPADPVTQKFLREQGHKYLKYHIIRETWQTWKNISNKVSQKELL